jgi:exodeoxyribonuclease VII small subunit
MADARPAGEGFEAVLRRLEDLVRRLEGGDLGLEEALKTFEEGTVLSRRAVAMLDEADARLEVLLRRDDGTDVVRPVASLDDIGADRGEVHAVAGRQGGSSQGPRGAPSAAGGEGELPF